MPGFTFEVALWIQLAAAGLGGLQGALCAAGEKRGHVDLLGVVTIGITAALGGSLLRDIVLNQPATVIWQNGYLLIAAAFAILGMALRPLFSRADDAFTVLDAIVMGLFGAIATSKALSLGVGPAGSLVVGVIGAIGGGVLRDVILRRPISFLYVGTLYATAAGAGAAALIVLNALGVPIPIAGLVCLAVTVAIRVGAVYLGWMLPEQRVLIVRRASPSVSSE